MPSLPTESRDATAATAAGNTTLNLVINLTTAKPLGLETELLARADRLMAAVHESAIGMSGKWLELLKEIAPAVTRAAILRDPALPSGIGQFGAIQSAAPSFGIEITPIDVRDPAGIERGITDFVRKPNGGLIVAASPAALINRSVIITVAAEHRLPAMYFQNDFGRAGGLISYGPDAVAEYGQAASYIDRILKGEKPADLPVQAPTHATEMVAAGGADLAVMPVSEILHAAGVDFAGSLPPEIQFIQVFSARF